MEKSLVSVICVCYNQGPYIRETLESVLKQTYEPVELIVVDDGSEDDSLKEIVQVVRAHPRIQFIHNKINQGYCKAFNQGWKRAKGEYAIDLAGDDLLYEGRLKQQVALFEKSHEQVGVVFSDAHYIDQQGNKLNAHFTGTNPRVKLGKVPEGDLYRVLLSRYLIPAPTMMMRQPVLEELGGYDEDLAYEDFDFWVRSARRYHYAYLPQCTTAIRVSPDSLSSRLYAAQDLQLHSTYLVCEKAQALSCDQQDQEALGQRLQYEMRQAVFNGNFAEALNFYRMLKEISQVTIPYRLLSWMARNKIKITAIWNRYRRWRGY